MIIRRKKFSEIQEKSCFVTFSRWMPFWTTFVWTIVYLNYWHDFISCSSNQHITCSFELFFNKFSFVINHEGRSLLNWYRFNTKKISHEHKIVQMEIEIQFKWTKIFFGSFELFFHLNYFMFTWNISLCLNYINLIVQKNKRTDRQAKFLYRWPNFMNYNKTKLNL